MINGDQLPELREGDEYPGASWFNSARRLIYRALRLNVADGSGLEISQGMDGAVISGQAAGGGGGAVYDFISPSSGIPAGSTVVHNARSVLNVHAQDVPASVVTIYGYNPDRRHYIVIDWDCG